MADAEDTTKPGTPVEQTASSVSDALKVDPEKGEQLIEGEITRLFQQGEETACYFKPSTDVRSLDLEGHRVGGVGELQLTHGRHDVPRKLDVNRVQTDGRPRVGSKIAVVFTPRRWG